MTIIIFIGGDFAVLYVYYYRFTGLLHLESLFSTVNLCDYMLLVREEVMVAFQ